MKSRYSLAAALLTLPAVALAHPGHEPGWIAGAMHPLTGVDHLMAMLAVGLWAAQLGGRLRWVVPMSFVCLMLVGALLGVSGWHVGAAEQGIAASVCVLGLLLAGAVRLRAAACVSLASVFALFHGYAHGAEAPASSLATYMAGFAASTAALHGIGLFAASMLALQRSQIVRWTGAAMAVGGLALFAA